MKVWEEGSLREGNSFQRVPSLDSGLESFRKDGIEPMRCRVLATLITFGLMLGCASDHSIKVLRTFAENYEPSFEGVLPKVPDCPSDVAEALSNLGESEDCDKYVLLILLKLSRWYVWHFHQGYDLRAFDSDTIENPILLHFCKILDIDPSVASRLEEFHTYLPLEYVESRGGFFQ